MACCNLGSFEYPAWWAGASTVQVTYTGTGNSGSLSKADVEFLPQGVSWAAGLLVPWSQVRTIEKLT